MAYKCTLCGADITIHDDGLGHCAGCGMTYTLTALRAMAAGSMPDTSQATTWKPILLATVRYLICEPLPN